MQYQNPNYFGQYIPQQMNPYMQRMENLQQFQQAIQQPTMPMPTQMQSASQFTSLGKIVENVDTVKTTEIPYQGVYYFPKADGTEIYSKQWLENGQTRILTFKPVSDDNPSNLSNAEENVKASAIDELLKGIQDDIKTINEKIDKISKPARAKKGDSEDEKSD